MPLALRTPRKGKFVTYLAYDLQDLYLVRLPKPSTFLTVDKY